MIHFESIIERKENVASVCVCVYIGSHDLTQVLGETTAFTACTIYDDLFEVKKKSKCDSLKSQSPDGIFIKMARIVCFSHPKVFPYESLSKLPIGRYDIPTS